jgi:hypothetical protein
MNLRDLINECIAIKEGNKEFILSYLPDEWTAEIGNQVSYVGLGEVPGEFYGEGDTPEEAVADLLKNLKEGRTADDD